MLALEILFLVLALACAILSAVYRNTEWSIATIFGTFIFSVLFGFFLGKSDIETTENTTPPTEQVN